MSELHSNGQRGSGIEEIANAFSSALSKRKAALMPYFTLGFPDPETSLEVIKAIAPYCDLIELGVPFSDPIADGPIIQRSTQTALDAGVTTAKCLEMVRELRMQGVSVPLLMMGYYNPILAFGEDRYPVALADAGADGLIVPDLPLEESENLRKLAVASGLPLISFIAPTTVAARIELIVPKANGFIYLVSVTGVTGARQDLATNLAGFVSDIRSQTDLPVAIGFGISTPEQASDIGDIADGVIVGSALIRAVDSAVDKPRAAADFVADLQAALAR
jgi:tryptophan synthase alpha chain